MKTQISRHSDRPAKRYSAVYQQQGRMISDSDGNELVDVLRRLLDEALHDVLDGGVPRGRGVELIAAPALDGGQPFRIRPGRVYADGVAAELVPAAGGERPFRYAQQADFPAAAELPQGAPYALYVDLWQRTVVSLEDPPDDPHLRDPALHGADTTTRTQAMAQLKWAPDGVEPEDPAQNPPHGDAPLDVVLRAQREQDDLCDPCADEVTIETRTGNYLFRLEVHAVEGDPANPDRLTLKWSSENGAEQHAVGTETPEFKDGAWTYELYDEVSEKHLGVHLSSGFTPTRGRLIHKAASEEYAALVTGVEPWVRRWDGSCVLRRDGSGWVLEDGRDRAAPLSTGGDPSAHGHMAFADGALAVDLQHLTFTLGLDGRTFVAGDHWLAAVREAIHGTGAQVLAATPPLGVVHHYLRLARVDAAGNLMPPTPGERRRLAFPPLTDLRAGDVGYESSCAPDAARPLFDASHATVQEALDRICALAAEHVGYAPDCRPAAAEPLFDPAVHDTVEKALDRVCALAAEHVGYRPDCESGAAEPLLDPEVHDTVKKALDRICALAAEHVAYTPSCDGSDLQEAATVQQALDLLCNRPVGGGEGGCRVTVGEEGEFRTLEQAVEELQGRGRTDLRLCLLPGEHEVENGLAIVRPGVHLSICGGGLGSRLRLLSGGLLTVDPNARVFNPASLTLRDLAVGDDNLMSVEVRDCPQIELSGVEMTGQTTVTQPLLRIGGGERVRLIGCRFLAQEASRVDRRPEVLADLSVARNRNDVIELSDLILGSDRQSFERDLRVIGRELANDPDLRAEWAGEIGERLESLRPAERRHFEPFVEALTLPGMGPSGLEEALRRVLAVNGSAGHALTLEDADAHTVIEDCEFAGRLQVYGESQDTDLNESALDRLLRSSTSLNFTTAGKSFHLRGSRLSSLSCRAAQLTDEQGTLNLAGVYRSAQLSDNVFESYANQFVAEFLNLTANQFLSAEPSLGWALAQRAAYVGNHSHSESGLTDFSRETEEAANRRFLTRGSGGGGNGGSSNGNTGDRNPR